jgi:hypothetical protein
VRYVALEAHIGAAPRPTRIPAYVKMGNNSKTSKEL